MTESAKPPNTITVRHDYTHWSVTEHDPVRGAVAFGVDQSDDSYWCLKCRGRDCAHVAAVRAHTGNRRPS